MASREVVVLSAVRSAVGAFGGSLADFDTSELAGIVMKEAIARSSVDPQLINYVTVGTTMPTDSRYAYASRVASIRPACRWNPSPCRSPACAPPASRAS